MASLYPSLEDMKADRIIQAQHQAFASIQNAEASAPPTAPPAYSTMPRTDEASPSALAHLYPSLHDYMGLELSPEVIKANLPEYAEEAAQIRALAVPQPGGVVPAGRAAAASSMIAPLSGQSLGLQRAYVSHGIREVTLCKDGDGKVGLRAKALNTGVFVSLVQKGSPAAQAGLRFGDQILQINGENVAGFSMDKVHRIFKKADAKSIVLAVRDRPFERTITLHKDSVGHIGFHFKDGCIITIVKDSSAARNGLLTDHNLLEVNGQNVVALKDKGITKIIDEGGNIITITIMPSFVYKHMVKSMAVDLVKKTMDHSVPDL